MSTSNPLRYGDFAYLRVKQVSKFGAFLDTGTHKDILLPFHEQSQKIEMGKSYMVAIIMDTQTERPIATQNFKKYINLDTSSLQSGMEVDILISHFTKLGANAIINNEFEGLLYKNQIYTKLNIGDRLKAYIKEIRDNGKVDLALSKPGIAAMEDDIQKVILYLKNHHHFAPLGDYSEPSVIYRELGISKKAFKKAIGILYKKKLINITDSGIELL